MESANDTTVQQVTRLSVTPIEGDPEHIHVPVKPKRGRPPKPKPKEEFQIYQEMSRIPLRDPTPAIDLEPIQNQMIGLSVAFTELRKSVDDISSGSELLFQSVAEQINDVKACIGNIEYPSPVVTNQSTPITDVVLSSFSALGYAMSARVLLLLALIGAFVLAVMAIQRGDMMGLGTLISYSLLTVVPVTVLEVLKRIEFRGRISDDETDRFRISSAA